MRVLFIPMAVASHYYPMVPLAWAFRAAGHDVRIAGQPSVVEPIVRSGLTAVPVGTGFDLLAAVGLAGAAVRREAGKLHGDFGELSAIPPEDRLRYAALKQAPHVEAAEAMAADLVPLVREWRPDVVVSDPVTLVAPLVAEIAGAPLMHHLWGPQTPSATRFPGYGLDPERWPAELVALYERFGTEVRRDYSVRTLAPCPPSLQTVDAAGRYTYRFVPYNGTGALPAREVRTVGRDRVLLSWSMSNTATLGAASTGGESPLAEVVSSLAVLDADLVVTIKASDRAGLGDVPAGVHVVEETPLHLLLPTCAAAVNHGGAGTMLTVACSGVPQVIAAQNPDQAFNAERVAAVGAGISIGAAHSREDGLVSAVARVLSDNDCRKAAGALREENTGQPIPADVVRAVEELVRADVVVGE